MIGILRVNKNRGCIVHTIIEDECGNQKVLDFNPT